MSGVSLSQWQCTVGRLLAGLCRVSVDSGIARGLVAVAARAADSKVTQVGSSSVSGAGSLLFTLAVLGMMILPVV